MVIAVSNPISDGIVPCSPLALKSNFSVSAMLKVCPNTEASVATDGLNEGCSVVAATVGPAEGCGALEGEGVGARLGLLDASSVVAAAVGVGEGCLLVGELEGARVGARLGIRVWFSSATVGLGVSKRVGL